MNAAPSERIGRGTPTGTSVEVMLTAARALKTLGLDRPDDVEKKASNGEQRAYDADAGTKALANDSDHHDSHERNDSACARRPAKATIRLPSAVHEKSRMLRWEDRSTNSHWTTKVQRALRRLRSMRCLTRRTIFLTLTRTARRSESRARSARIPFVRRPVAVGPPR